MVPRGFSNAEKAECVRWSIEGYGDNGGQGCLWNKYRKSAPSSDSIRLWVTQYRSGTDHSHRGGNGRPRVTNEDKAAIRQVLEKNTGVSLHNGGRQTGVFNSTIQRCFRNDLHVFLYKIQFGPKLGDGDKQARVHFAHSSLSKLARNARCHKK